MMIMSMHRKVAVIGMMLVMIFGLQLGNGGKIKLSNSAQHNRTIAGTNRTISGTNRTISGTNRTIAGTNRTIAGTNRTIAGTNRTTGHKLGKHKNLTNPIQKHPSAVDRSPRTDVPSAPPLDDGGSRTGESSTVPIIHAREVQPKRKKAKPTASLIDCPYRDNIALKGEHRKRGQACGVNATDPWITEYYVDPNQFPDGIIRIRVQVLNRTQFPILDTHPLVLLASHPTLGTSFMVPLVTQGAKLYDTTRMLCPISSHALYADNIKSLTAHNDESTKNAVQIHNVQRIESPINDTKLEPYNVSISLATSYRLGVIPVFMEAMSQNDMSLRTSNKAITGRAEMGDPAVYRFDFVPGQDWVEVKIEGLDSVCAVVVFQEYECPIDDTLETISLDSVRASVLAKAWIPISKPKHSHTVYIIVIASPTSGICGKIPVAGLQPVASKRYKISVAFMTAETGYIAPVFVVIAFLGFVLVVTELPTLHRKFLKLKQNAADHITGDLTSPDSLHPPGSLSIQADGPDAGVPQVIHEVPQLGAPVQGGLFDTGASDDATIIADLINLGHSSSESDLGGGDGGSGRWPGISHAKRIERNKSSSVKECKHGDGQQSRIQLGREIGRRGLEDVNRTIVSLAEIGGIVDEKDGMENVLFDASQVHSMHASTSAQTAANPAVIEVNAYPYATKKATKIKAISNGQIAKGFSNKMGHEGGLEMTNLGGGGRSGPRRWSANEFRGTKRSAGCSTTTSERGTIAQVFTSRDSSEEGLPRHGHSGDSTVCEPRHGSRESTASSDDQCILERIQEDSVGVPTDETDFRGSYCWYQVIASSFLTLVVAALVIRFNLISHPGVYLEQCYFNFGCAKRLGNAIPALNALVSNSAYVVCGMRLWMLVETRKSQHDRMQLGRVSITKSCPIGLDPKPDISRAMVVALVAQGILSGCYHMCPDRWYYLFDTCLLFALVTLPIMKLFAARHPTTPPERFYLAWIAVVAYSWLAAITRPSLIFWLVFVVAELVLLPALSLQLYYARFTDFDLLSPKTWKGLKVMLSQEWNHGHRGVIFKKKFTLIVIGNIVNFIISFIGAATQQLPASSWTLFVFVTSTVSYFCYYVVLKVSHRESLTGRFVLYTFAGVLCWVCAMVFFFIPTTNWSLTPAESRNYNRPCLFMDFFDTHDFWHIFSAAGIYFSFMAIIAVDDGLKHIPRTEIAVF